MGISIDEDGNIEGYVYTIKDVLKEKYRCKWDPNIGNWTIGERTDIAKLKKYIENINLENNQTVECGLNGCSNTRKKCFATCWKCRSSALTQ
jgi:hypothetical protein